MRPQNVNDSALVLSNSTNFTSLCGDLESPSSNSWEISMKREWSAFQSVAHPATLESPKPRRSRRRFRTFEMPSGGIWSPPNSDHGNETEFETRRRHLSTPFPSPPSSLTGSLTNCTCYSRHFSPHKPSSSRLVALLGSRPLIQKINLNGPKNETTYSNSSRRTDEFRKKLHCLRDDSGPGPNNEPF